MRLPLCSRNFVRAKSFCHYPTPPPSLTYCDVGFRSQVNAFKNKRSPLVTGSIYRSYRSGLTTDRPLVQFKHARRR